MADADFTLHSQLEADSVHLCDLALCRVLVMNDARFPWIILVPRRAGCSELTDLGDEDSSLLMQEIRAASRMMMQAIRPDKLNIATLGNKVPQLHIHIVARFTTDEAWPEPVWGKGEREAYAPDKLREMVGRMGKGLMSGSIITKIGL
jgi:diadenosine tetraphosphate (Ap4A) HIT family hydrolase